VTKRVIFYLLNSKMWSYEVYCTVMGKVCMKKCFFPFLMPSALATHLGSATTGPIEKVKQKLEEASGLPLHNSNLVKLAVSQYRVSF
jgi:hypothetical protein